MKYLFLKLIGIFLGLALFIFLCFLWLILTSSGLKFFVMIFPHFIPGELKIDKAEGRLYDSFSLKNISYRDNAISFDLENISLDWKFVEILLHHQIFIKKIQLEKLNIVSISSETEKSKTPFFLPDFLPPHWQIDQLRLNNVAYEGYKIPNSYWTIQSDIENQHLQYKLTGDFLKGNIHSQGDLYFLKNTQWQIFFHADNNYFKINTNIGNIRPTLEGQWKITVQDLSKIWAGAHGEVKSDGNLAGTLRSPAIKADFNAHHLYFSNSTQQIENLSGHIQGTLQAHKLDLILQKDNLNLTLALQGNYDQTQWRGDLNKLNFNSPLTGKWYLKHSAQIQLTLQKYAIHHLLIENPNSFLALDAIWEKNKGGVLNETGRFYIPALNITLKKFVVHAEGNTQQIQYQANAFSGKGQLTAQGKVYLTETPSLQTVIKGQNFLAVNIPLYKVWASPSLQLEKKSNQYILKGDIFIPKATIISPDYRQNTITLPKETIIENNAQHNKTTMQNIEFYSDILLRLGNNIHVQAEGLSAQLEGQVRLQDAPNHPTLAQGELIISQGKYKAYGQKFIIHNGRLIFNHNIITNPRLQIQAGKQVTLINPVTSGDNFNAPFYQMQKTQVGVEVTNTLEEPHMTLFSSPANLSQSDILSYILFEKPLDAISPLDAALLLRATSATKFGTSGFEEVMKGIKNTTGFEKFSIESVHYLDPATASVKESTSLVLGKALSPKLYLSYSVGLMDPINILTLKYFLSPQWILQSSSSSLGTGLDIFYAAEKN